VQGTLEAGQPIMLIILLVSSMLNAAYFLPIAYHAFFCSPEKAMFGNDVQEAPLWCVVPPVITAAGSVCLFFYPTVFVRLAELAIGL
jgi:multicomponent Na+:H+ antiporter subunit D